MTGQYDDLQAMAELRQIGSRNAGLPEFRDFSTHLRDTQLAGRTMAGALTVDVVAQGYSLSYDQAPAPVTP